jgi:hypothetical protein
MPKISERKRILLDIEFLVRHFAAELVNVNYGSEEEKAINVEILALLELKAGILSSCFLNPPNRIPKSDSFLPLIFQLPCEQFRQQTRLKRETFFHVLSLTQDDPIFYNRSLRPQKQVWLQLVVALERFGCYGNGASIGRVARMAGIGAGTATLYTHRVIKALLKHRSIIKWPKRTQRELSSAYHDETYGLFVGCVGFVDELFLFCSCFF